MPTWAQWTMFGMIVLLVIAQRDYSGTIGELSTQIAKLKRKINKLLIEIQRLESKNKKDGTDKE